MLSNSTKQSMLHKVFLSGIQWYSKRQANTKGNVGQKESLLMMYVSSLPESQWTFTVVHPFPSYVEAIA